MIAIIYGKIINSWKLNPNDWLFKLKHYFNCFGTTPLQWEIFDGNAFLLKLNQPEEAIWVAVCIKAIFKQIVPLDVQLTIGIGTETQRGAKLRLNAGSAYDNCEWQSETITKNTHFLVHSTETINDNAINLLLEFALHEMDKWSVGEAEIVELLIVFPEKNQQEIAEWLKIKQSAVSQRRKRSQYDLIKKLNEFYKQQFP